MRVHDRYSGRDVELPARVEPGRYKLLAPALLNDEVRLGLGQTLWSDGGANCAFEGEASREFVQASGEGKGEASEEVIDAAVQAVVDAWAQGADALPSPVLPAILGQITQPTELEVALQDVLDKGHLHAIAARPRMAMRYERELQPLSRARRIASGAVVRLASHSEDWLRREITGVTPLALLAEVSDDDVVIYENVVFARLLDRLAGALRKRLQDVDLVQAKQIEAAALSHAERLDFRLRNALCGLWGLSFDADPAAAEAARDTRRQIEDQLHKVQQLRHGALYGSIPRSQRIPLALKPTNVLLHDQHYRHLRTLWILAHASSERRPPDARERIEAERARGAQFSRYVELLVRHALTQIKLVRPLGSAADTYRFEHRALYLSRDADGLVLSLDGTGRALHIIAARRGATPWQPGSTRHIVFCHRNATDQGDESQAFGASSVLHPLEFYGVERMRQAIEHWLYRSVLSHFPPRLRRVPTGVREQISAIVGAAVRTEGQDMIFERPMDGVLRAKLESAISAGHLNDGSMAEMASALNDLKLFALCRLCTRQASGRDVDADRRGIQLVCRECGHRWSLQYQAGSATRASFALSAAAALGFEEAGSLEMTIAFPD